MRLLLLPLFLILITSTVFAQDSKETTNHEHYKNEIGIAISPVYFVKENVLTYAMHIDYVYSIPNTKFGLGVSFERIFQAPKHTTFGLVIAYRPIEKLSFTVSPGVAFEDGDSASLFAMHVETIYGFELGKLHIGPALAFAYDPNDYHISLGVHIGYGF
ncbi:MAG: hypothetical protein L3J14_02130 [Flavobacteriaceae bacterium]|nr:hypothetical protein [Flavobacteriaceae bacterium]